MQISGAENNMNSTESVKSVQENVKCPLCQKSDINVTFVDGYMTWHTSKISSGAKRTRAYVEPRYTIHNKCPECKAGQKEIGEAIEKGQTKRMSYEERLKRIKEAGLSTQIETKT